MSALRKVWIWAVAAVLAVIAILVVAWIMGDAQQTRWIETPVAAPAHSPAQKPAGAQ